MKIEEELKKKGWEEKEIRKHLKLIERSATKTVTIRIFDALVFWGALGLILLGNFIIAVVIVPFLLIMRGAILYFFIALFGLVFGVLITAIIKNIEKIHKEQKIILNLALPAFAIVTVYIMASLSNQLARLAEVAVLHPPIFIALTYVLSTLVPYYVYKLRAE